MVREGTFREDLYYRLYVFPIQLPPLRERREDIPLLACHLLAKSRERCAQAQVARFSEDALKLLGQFDWPGNVRQLEAFVERAVIACDGDVIEPRHLPRTLDPADPARRPQHPDDEQGVPRAEEAPARTGGHRPRARVRPRGAAAERLERDPGGGRGRHPAPELPDADAAARHQGRARPPSTSGSADARQRDERGLRSGVKLRPLRVAYISAGDLCTPRIQPASTAIDASSASVRPAIPQDFGLIA